MVHKSSAGSDMFGLLKKIFGTAQDRKIKKYFKIVAEINRWDQQYQSLTDDQLRGKTTEFRNRLQSGETLDQILPEAYATVKSACRRLCGTQVHVSGYDQQWDMVPYDVQLVGAIAMHHCAIAEMQTGEGKTLTATLPLYLNALTCKPVHLVTVNDYLAQRDCQWVGSILRWLGLTTGALTNDVLPHERKAIYQNDVVYGTASEFGFDYLRDNSMANRKEDQVQRGYFFSIVDEIDSILIDEARTPLIISGPVPDSRQMYNDLKDGVALLVKMQRDLCSRLATEARKALESTGRLEEGAPERAKKSKDQQAIEREAMHKLWLVSKGTPRNKILKRLREDPDIRDEIDQWDLYYTSDQNKEEKANAFAELYVIVDEKSSEFELTDKGIAAWGSGQSGSADDFVMLDLGGEYAKIDADVTLDEDAKLEKKIAINEEDAQRKERAHNLRQLLRAHLLMERDVDYIVHEDKIVIIDEHTGRPQPGRRFSDGLHQSIEAKESVKIQDETQTYATVTLQNYFRMYEKLAGMTGTAMTEANEFKEIYKLDVLSIPTHVKCQRKDFDDEVYMTEREKYNAILKEIREVHDQGRPLLIGTESVEISEKLSRILRQNRMDHTVLNAKQHDREAEIVAQAGRKGSITIATNMAGRGTDIKLEKGVAVLGGLYVMGTTRHQSRRIDRQLRGRCGRQGDPGTSKFYISFEDNLMRLFASPRLSAMIKRFRPPEGEPISAGILSKSIETAQKRIESRNYTIRKHTLEYDDVMNKQRHEIYAFRNEVLHTDDLQGIMEDLLESICVTVSEDYFKSRSEEGGWDPEGFRQWLVEHFPITFGVGAFDDDHLHLEDIEKMASGKVIEAFHKKILHEKHKLENLPSSPLSTLKESQSLITGAMRGIVIRRLDQLWQEHLLTMDHLRSEVNLRSVGQKDPLVEFKHEAFILFDKLGRQLKEDISRDLFRFEIVPYDPTFLSHTMSKFKLETQRSLVNELENPSQPEASTGSQALGDAGVQEEQRIPQQPIVLGPRSGRNEECPCGSGKKYKKCCGVMAFERE